MAVSRIVARSMKTWPRRGPRTASATARTTVGSASPASAQSRCPDVHVGGGEHADRVERLEQPGRARREAHVEAVALVDRGVGVSGAAAGSSSMSGSWVMRRRPGSLRASTSAAGGRQANTPQGTPSTAGVSGPDHAAHEQVQDPAEVAVGVVARQPPAQVAVQRDGVEQRLQRVVRLLHLRGQRGGAVVPGGQRLARRARAGWSCSRRRRSGARRPRRAAARRGRCCR